MAGRSSVGECVGRRGHTGVVTTDEIIAYQAAVRVIASECAEKVRRHGGTPRQIAEEYDRVEVFCGRPEPIVCGHDESAPPPGEG